MPGAALFTTLLIVVPVCDGAKLLYVVPSVEDCHLIVEPVFPVKLTVGAALLLHINADVLEIVPATVTASV